MSDADNREWRFFVMPPATGLIHGYLGIDNDTLWSISRDEVPDLLRLLKSLRHSPDAGKEQPAL